MGNCAPTYFSSLSVIKTFDGDELTSESCTQERIDHLKILQEASQKDSDIHDLGSDLYSLMSEGYTLNGGQLEKINRAWKEHDNLQHRANSEERTNLIPEIIELNRQSFRMTNKHIQIFEEAIDIMESSKLKLDIKSSDEERYLILSEQNNLSAILLRLIVRYFENLADFCHLFANGYQLTERGKGLAIQLEPLNEDYNELLSERIRKGSSQRKKQIRIKEELLDIMRDIIYIQEEIKEEFTKTDFRGS